LTIEIEFPTTILKNNRLLRQSIQFTFSPMNELFTSLHVLRSPKNHSLMISWELKAQTIMNSILRDDFDFFGPLFDYSIPSFLLPSLTWSVKNVTEEFDQLQRNLYSLKREQIIHHFSVAQGIREKEFQPSKKLQLEWDSYTSNGLEKLTDAFLTNQKGCSDRLIEFLKKYNELIFNDIWEEVHIKNILCEEITKQSQYITQQGLNATIIALKNDKIYWAGKKLMLYQPFKEQITMAIEDKITFIPSYFVWPHLFVETIATGICITYSVNIPNATNFTPEKMQFILSAVGDTTRIQILNFLKQAENTNQGLAQLLNLSESNISHHLAILRTTHLISQRRVGKYVLYKVTPVVTNLIPTFFDNLPDYYSE